MAVQLPLALRPDHLCMKPDGGQLFITGEGRDAIVIAYPYRTEVAQTSLTGRAPGAMAVSSNPEFLFVANPAAGSVTIFDINTQRVVAVTAVGGQPSEIVITPDQQYALVLNRGSGDMAVIRIAAIQAGRSKSAALFTMVPVGARPVSAVVRGV
jgi:DNA-binding beta-propeller fold protein YncE